MSFYNLKYVFVIVLALFFGHKFAVAENVIEINSYKFLLPNFNTYSEEVQIIVISLEEGMHCQNLMTENIKKLNSIPSIDPYFVAYRALINIQYRTTLGEIEEANQYIDKYIDDKDFPYLGRLFLMKGALMMSMHSYSEAISDYHIAIKKFTINNDTLGLIHGHYKQLMLYVYSDNKEYAKNSFLTALTLCQKNNYENGLILIYNTYGKYSSKWDLAYASDLLQKSLGVS